MARAPLSPAKASRSPARRSRTGAADAPPPSILSPPSPARAREVQNRAPAASGSIYVYGRSPAMPGLLRQLINARLQPFVRFLSQMVADLDEIRRLAPN